VSRAVLELAVWQVARELAESLSHWAAPERPGARVEAVLWALLDLLEAQPAPEEPAGSGAQVEPVRAFEELAVAQAAAKRVVARDLSVVMAAPA
jgi:hypothetical protein